MQARRSAEQGVRILSGLPASCSTGLHSCGRSALLRQKLVQLRHEGADVLELAVDRGEADIGHLVHLTQAIHHQLSDPGGGHLPIHLVLKGLLNLIGDPLQLAEGHRALLTGAQHTVEQLALVKGLAAAVLFDDHQGQALHRLIGGKALVAGQALPPAADAGPLVRRPGIHHLALQMGTIGTFHGVLPPSAVWPASVRRLFTAMLSA